MVPYLFYGLFIGFWIGVTVGPLAVLCLQRSMQDGIWSGLAIGLGSSLANLLFASIAVFGVHFVQPFFAVYGPYIRLGGSLFILYIAIHLLRQPVRLDGSIYRPMSNGAAFLTAVGIHFATPISIASYAVFITFINVQIISFAQAIWFLVGIFAGNIGWWLMLSAASSYISSFLTKKHIRIIVIIASCLLIAVSLFGITLALINLLA